MMFYRIASALLGYPDAALRAALPEIAAAITTADDLAPAERGSLGSMAAALSLSDPIGAEEDYVRTFDMVPEHSLHLTHHLIGEDKNRGPALIDLSEYYRQHDIEITEKELPDYLPLMLEFVSLLEVEEGRQFLARWNKVLRQLQANLAAAGSLYAGLVGLVEARSRPAGSGDETEAVAATPKSNPCLADGDFDPPVNWAAPAVALAPGACGSSPSATDCSPLRLHRRDALMSATAAPRTGQ